MVKIRDIDNFLVELYDQHNFIRDNNDYSVEFIATPWDISSVGESAVKTLFLDQEGDRSLSMYNVDQLMQLRPNSVFLQTVYPTTHIEFHSWFVTTARANLEYVPTDASNMFVFDALLGGYSNARHLIFNTIQELNLLEKGLINLQVRSEEGIGFSYRSPWLDKFEVTGFVEATVNNGKIFTMTPINNLDKQVYWSQVIPNNVYNNTSISIVAETETGNSDFFITEKTIKPLLARRPFVVYGCKGFLRHLHRLGFKTFGEWIDESYDNIEDNFSRARAVVKSVVDFDHKDVSKMQDVLYHNRELALNTQHWLQPIKDLCTYRLEA